MNAAKKIGNIFFSAFCYFMAFLGVVIAFLAISEAVVDQSARVLPSYERMDLSPLLEKEEWTEEEYELLYRQTGLGRCALDQMKDRKQDLISFQDALFYEGTVRHQMAAFSTPHDYLEDYVAPIAPLENGDIILTSTCHTLGWRNGHTGIVINASNMKTLESISPGVNSCVGDAGWFQSSSNFMVLRLKDASLEERNKIAFDAASMLYDIPYSLLVGIFMPKDQGEEPQATNCSHLVWQAYFNAGYDIDSDGGPVCTSRDIAHCNLFQIVQVFGFDPAHLW